MKKPHFGGSRINIYKNDINTKYELSLTSDVYSNYYSFKKSFKKPSPINISDVNEVFKLLSHLEMDSLKSKKISSDQYYETN